MIGFQDYIVNNKISVTKLADEIGIKASTIWRWFNVNKVPNKYHDFLSSKLNINKEYINKVINDISTYSPKKKDFNSYRIVENIVYIELKNKKGLVKETLIDLDDFKKVKSLGLHWFLKYEDDNDEWYCAASKRYTDSDGKRKGTIIHLHQFILGGCDCVDHIEHKMDGTLDNRKCNLRKVERADNSANRRGANKNSKTGVRNVNWIENQNEYWVQISRKGVRYKWIFPSTQFDEACAFAEAKRKEIFGEFAGNGIKDY